MTKDEALALFQQAKLAVNEKNYDAAIPSLTKAAEFGLPMAQYGLALCYTHGKGVAQNYETALFWAEKAKAGGYEQAEKLISSLLFNQGNALMRENRYREAILPMKKSAEYGEPKAMYQMAVCCQHTDDQENALRWARRAKEAGMSEAGPLVKQIREANDYFRRALYAEKKDDPSAILLLKLASYANHAQAMFRLAQLESMTYQTLSQTDSLLQEIISTLTNSAELGCMHAQAALALIYDAQAANRSYSVFPIEDKLRDPEKALYWFVKAAENGNSNIAGLLAGETGKRLGLDTQAQYSWFMKSVELGLSDSQLELGTAYCQHSDNIWFTTFCRKDLQNLEYDIDKAIELLIKAAEQENPDAQIELYMIYSSSKFNKMHNPKARYWRARIDQNPTFPKILPPMAELLSQGKNDFAEPEQIEPLLGIMRKWANKLKD